MFSDTAQMYASGVSRWTCRDSDWLCPEVMSQWVAVRCHIVYGNGKLSLAAAPMMEASRLDNVLPACLYSPTYVVKDFPIARYQGLQFVSYTSSTTAMDKAAECVRVCVCACVRVCMCVCACACVSACVRIHAV